jgi:2-polyprenyl-6-methoxyphenol hydroxylase-like FAD-dependent oxidoreductase
VAPLGDEKLLRRYARERLAPTWAMGQLTDGLLQLFAHRRRRCGNFATGA